MNVVVGRRVFLGSAAAAGIGTVSGGLVLSSGLRAQTQAGSDAIENELVKQLHESVRGMRGPRRGESARKLASTLRLSAARYETRGVDEAFRSYLQATIRRDGRDALLSRELDLQMFAAEAREYGLTRLPAFSPVDSTVREQVLDSLLVGGITPLLTKVAAKLDQISEGLDRLPTPSLVSARQYESCTDVANLLRILEITLAITCLWDPAMCVVITGMWVGLQISLWIYGC